MNLFFLLSSSTDVGKGLGGGRYVSIYVGDVYNLDAINDYAHPVCISEALAELPNVIEAYRSLPAVVQTYTRYEGTLAKGPYGGTIKHATGDTNDTIVNVAGYSVGLGAQVSRQKVRVIPVPETLQQIDNLLGISHSIGSAIWNFRWKGGSLNDITDRQRVR